MGGTTNGNVVTIDFIMDGINMWQEFNVGLTDNITEVMKIIDDALCYCFEFKVENHRLYFREIE